jgi:ribonucleoside-diphosphate reductase alpha chain
MKIEEPDVLKSDTTGVVVGCGTLYVTVVYYNDKPYKVYGSLGKAGGCAYVQIDNLCRAISIGLSQGADIEDYIITLMDTRCPSPMIYGASIPNTSCGDAIAKVLKKKITNNGISKEQT